MAEKNNEALVEATLFLAGRFLSLQELVMFTNINPLTLKEVLSKLKKKYSDNEAFAIIEREGSYKMDVHQEYSFLVNKIATGQTEFSKAEQETLSIVAYKQPITQAVVVKIRGNKAYEHVKHLLQVGLIKGKKRGHTLELHLDERFYDYFNIEKRKQEENSEDEASEEINGNIDEEVKSSEHLTKDDSNLNLEGEPLTQEKTDLPESLTREKDTGENEVTEELAETLTEDESIED